MTADELAEHLFDVANQLSRGAALVIDRDEKAQVAAIDLRAWRKAKASEAYASACVHLAAGMALLDERDWGSQYDLMFSLWLERAECEFLIGNFGTAEQLIGELLQRGASKVDLQAAMQVLSTLLGPAYFTDSHLFCLLACRMANISMQHGTCGASAHGCAYLGGILGPVFHRHSEGYRFGKLAWDLVEKHGFIAYQAKAYHSMGIVALWTQPLTTAIDFNRAAATVICVGAHWAR
jgi:predicted ATPase